MKKLLIIQADGPYFLHETLRVLEKSRAALKEFELTVLVSQAAFDQIKAAASPLIPGITTDKSKALEQSYDMSICLSLDEAAWELHGLVSSQHKAGPFKKKDQFSVPDLWSTFLLTVKANPPFLTFHLQDIYKNILGVKKTAPALPARQTLREIVLGKFNPEFFSEADHASLARELKDLFPHLPVRDLAEVDLIDDLGHTLYVGPAALQALRVCEAGAQGIFIGRKFQGLNLLPCEGEHFLLSTRGEGLHTKKLVPFIESVVRQGGPLLSMGYSVYQLDEENLFGAYLKALNPSDDSYPFYQVHVVLWNFLLSLFDVNLDVTKCSASQLEQLASDKEVLTKLMRLMDYALSSIDTIYHEVKAERSDAAKIAGHLKNLQEIDEVAAKLAETRPMLRPFLDFYRVRRGQNDGSTLVEQVQHTYLTYSEEHHALAALDELFSVTLRKNEASI